MKFLLNLRSLSKLFHRPTTLYWNDRWPAAVLKHSTFYASYFECLGDRQSTVLILNQGYVSRKFGYRCTLMKTRTSEHNWFVPHTTDSLFFVFPSDIWCKISKLLTYYEYQLIKCCLEGRLEGFKVSSWYLKIMKLVEERIT